MCLWGPGPDSNQCLGLILRIACDSSSVHLKPSGKNLTMNFFYISLNLTLARLLEQGVGLEPTASVVETPRSFLLSLPCPHLLAEHVAQQRVANLGLGRLSLVSSGPRSLDGPAQFLGPVQHITLL